MGVLLESSLGGQIEQRNVNLVSAVSRRRDFNRGTALEDNLYRDFGSIFATLFRARIVCLLLGALIALCMPSRGEAKESCPWINEATASGALDGAVTATVTHPEMSKDTDVATCVFVHQSGSTGIELRIEVETISGAHDAYAAYADRCGAAGMPLRAIGNEAMTCSYADKKRKKWVSEQVVGRVRDHAFTVRVSSNAESADRSVLREKARKMAEHLAGFLF
jgi:hypothetical protein